MQASQSAVLPVENHNRAAAPRERPESPDRHFSLVRAAYEKTTGNRWKKSDSEAYEENGLRKLPAETIISGVEAVTWRTPTKINSFRYFVREILTFSGPCNRARQRMQFETIVRRVRDNSVGRPDYSHIDFLEDVKCACAREAIAFDHDFYNELVDGRAFAGING